MALHKPAMTLRFKTVEDRLHRSNESSIDPRRDFGQSRTQRTRPEDQSGEDTLRPCRAGLVRRRNEDVIVVWYELVPTCAVEVVVAVLPGPLGWFQPHGDKSCHRATLWTWPRAVPHGTPARHWATCRQGELKVSHSEANRQRVAPPGSVIKSEVAWCDVMR